jgi:serine/threonine-protein kinase/endoribonuclease IRE1
LSKSSNGTIVFEGYHERPERKAAIKRLVKRSFDGNVNEIKILQGLKDCKNIVRYFAYYDDDEFIFIACERAEITLEKCISNGNIEEKELINVIYESCLGLAYLHRENILHRDIKPTNILISYLDDGQIRAMIGDFGLSKSLNMTQSSGSSVEGTLDWLAPELLEAIKHNKKVKATKLTDIFSMGCVIYYALTGGKHPFGEKLEREGNILKGNHKLDSLKSDEKLIYYNLIKSVIRLVALDRPPIEAVVNHPMFWTQKKKLDFFTHVSNRLKLKDNNTKSLVNELNKYQNNIYKQNDWMIDEMRQKVDKSRYKYQNSVTEIIRFIRDKSQHLDEWKDLLGKNADEYIEYFTSRFPTLLIYTYVIMQELSDETELSDYYKSYDKFKLPN